MPIMDLKDRETMADAIRTGLIWSAPAGAQEAALVLMARGEMPKPSYMPAQAQARFAELTGQEPDNGFASEGAGPV